MVSALFLSLSRPIISVVFEHGEFTAESAKITGTALFYYSFGMMGYAVCEVLNKSFYALSDGKTPMLTSLIGIIVNFIMAAFLIKVLKMGVGGLALASAVSSTTIAICLMFMINRRRKGVINLAFVINAIKIVICTAAAFVTAKGVDIFAGKLGTGMIITLIRLCVCAVPACIVYVLAAYVLKVTEVRSVAERFLKRG